MAKTKPMTNEEIFEIKKLALIAAIEKLTDIKRNLTLSNHRHLKKIKINEDVPAQYVIIEILLKKDTSNAEPQTTGYMEPFP